MNVLSIILLALFCAIGGYFIGLNRGNDTHKYDYDDGYENGWNDCITEIDFVKRGGESEIITHPELIFGEDWSETREHKARELLKQLDELFREDEEEDNVEILDGGEY